ncbi:hypothetical protein KAR34_05690, partial [bacterium]|nr:hypothetical protein [bacterium]
PALKVLGGVISKLYFGMNKCLQPRWSPVVLFILLSIAAILGVYIYYPLFFIGLLLLFFISLARLFERQCIQVMKFFWRPIILLSLLFIILAVFVIDKIFFEFLYYFPYRRWFVILLFAVFVLSFIRLVISFFRAKKEKKAAKKDEAAKPEVKK